MPDGRAGFESFFSRLGPADQSDRDQARANPPVVQFGGDFVVPSGNAKAKTPVDPSKTYKYNTYDMLGLSRTARSRSTDCRRRQRHAGRRRALTASITTRWSSTSRRRSRRISRSRQSIQGHPAVRPHRSWPRRSWRPATSSTPRTSRPGGRPSSNSSAALEARADQDGMEETSRR